MTEPCRPGKIEIIPLQPKVILRRGGAVKFLGRLIKAFTAIDPWRCEIHDRAWPLKTAQLEAESGINPRAVDDLWDAITVRPGGLVDPDSFIDSFLDPDLIDCGSRRCRQRHGQ